MAKLKAIACILIRFIQDLVDILDTAGGHIALLALGVYVCSRVMFLEKHSGEFVGALLYALKQASSSKTRRDRPVPAEVVEATTVSEVSLKKENEEEK